MSMKKSRKRAYIPPSHEVVNRKERTSTTRTAAPSRSARGGQRGGAYQYPEPSLKRTAKRLPIYFFLIFALQFYLLKDASEGRSTAQIALFAAAQAGIVTLIFAPFMHMMDRLGYNRWRKRQGLPAK